MKIVNWKKWFKYGGITFVVLLIISQIIGMQKVEYTKEDGTVVKISVNEKLAIEEKKRDKEKEKSLLGKLTSLESNVMKSLIRDDLDTYLSGNKSVLINHKLLVLPKKMSIYKIQSEYERNEVNADNLYKGKEYLISARVQRIDKGIMGGTNLYLQNGNILGALADLDSDYNKYTASLRKGNSVNLICDVSSFIMGSVTLNKCIPIHYWLGDKEKDIKNKILKNYNKDNPDSISNKFINYSKITASKLNNNSNCSSSNYDYKRCLQEIENLNK